MSAPVGTGRLVRLALRRERTIAPWWLLLLVAMSLMMIAYIHRNMPTQDVMTTYVDVINRNAFFRALGGDSVVPNVGYMAAWRSGGFLYIINAFAAIMAVIRHTRADEDAGRTELLRSAVVSRAAGLTSALVVAGGVALTGGVLVVIALLLQGMEPGGTVTYGAGITVTGWLFGAIAAVAAQVARTARTARAIALGILGVSYVMRYAGDASGLLWLKYASPLGWIHAVSPYRYDKWWLLLIAIGAGAILVVAAYTILGRRDLGEGLLPEGRGPATASWLRGPIALSWRLNRGLFAKWAAGVALFAAGAGGISTLTYQMSDHPAANIAQMVRGFGGNPDDNTQAAIWPIMLLFAYAVAVFPVLMVQRLRAEEKSGRSELTEGTVMTRVRWAGGQLVTLAVCTTVLYAVAGLVFGFFFGLLVGELPVDALRLLAGALGCVPAAWLIGAICFLAYGLVPRASVAIGWVVVAATAALGRVAGPLYGLWGGTPFEPFHYVPNTVGGAPFDPVPGLVMIVLSGLCVWGGLTALRRRDFGT